MRIRKEARFEVFMMLFFTVIGVVYMASYFLFPKRLQAADYAYQTVGLIGCLAFMLAIFSLLSLMQTIFRWGGLRYEPKTIEPLSTKKVVYRRTDIDEGCPVDNESEREWWACIVRHKKNCGICICVFTVMIAISVASIPIFFLLGSAMKGTAGSVLCVTAFCLFALGSLGDCFSGRKSEGWDYTSVELRPLVEYRVKKNIVSGTLQKEMDTEDFAYNIYLRDYQVYYDLDDDDTPFIAHYWWCDWQGQLIRIHLKASEAPEEDPE